MTLNESTKISPLLTASAAELSQKLAERQVSSRELVREHLRRIQEVDPKIHAFLHVNEGKALEVADEVDSARVRDEPLHPLAGVPIALKDIIVTTDEPTTAGSKILEGWVSPYDATVVRKIKEARLPILGKTNLDEFAMGSSTEHSAYGVTKNPWNLDRTPGGSGGGSAAAVAAFETPLALGTDTGGSIRQPAAVTGTVGVKPTYGAVSRYGAIAMASSLDQIGPAARNVLDAAMLQELISGHDPKDSTSLSGDATGLVAAVVAGDITGMRIGVVKELDGEGYQEGVSQCFGKTLGLLREAGAEIVEVSAPNFKTALSAYYIIMPSEASSNLARFDGIRFGVRANPGGNPTIERMVAATRAAGFGREVKRRILLGTYALSAGYYDAYYGAAQKVRTIIQQDFRSAFEKVDVLITPTTPVTAFGFGEKLKDPMTMYMNDIATIPANLAGIPGLSLPVGLAAEDGLPVGAQILAPARQDASVYRVGAVLEELLRHQWGGPLADQAPTL